MGWKYTEEILREAVAESVSIAGVLRRLGIVQSGGMHAHVSRTVKRLGIDTSHFTGQRWRRDRTFPDNRPREHMLRLLPPGSNRPATKRLRRALLRSGRPYACEKCGNDGTWAGQPLTLHVDHIDGHYLDCRPENLRFLCPNCHAQTPTHSGRNKNRRAYSAVVPR
jgi:predicted RNA-binding Zn-ribbon protein involved in translation (DUF1610 family)